MVSLKHTAIAVVAASAIALTSFNVTPAKADTGDAIALAAIAGLFGTVAVLASRDRYDGTYRHRYAGPYPGPRYHGPVHRSPRWGGWHSHHGRR